MLKELKFGDACQAETAADSDLQPKLPTSSPNNAKPFVSGSLFFRLCHANSNSFGYLTIPVTP